MIQSSHKLYHMDAWRIQTIEDLELLRFKNWMQPGNIIVIEWPSVLMTLDKYFFEKTPYSNVDFVVNSDNSRELRTYFKD